MPKTSNAFTGLRSAPQKRRNSGKRPRTTGSLSRLLMGLLLGVFLTTGLELAYLYLGRPPVAVADKTALWEHLTGSISVHRRMAAEAKPAPFPASEDVFEAAAQSYRSACAQCHGVPGHEAAVGRQMLPRAQQFFGRDRKATAATPVGELFWPIAFGIRRSGMPAYNHVLSNTQLWQLALLLHSADQDLPDPVTKLLTAPIVSNAQSSVTVDLPGPNLRGPTRPINKDHLAPSERPESQF